MEENFKVNSYCDKRCVYYESKESISYTEPSGKTMIDICNYKGTARSFGCMNGCLNGTPKFVRDEEDEK